MVAIAHTAALALVAALAALAHTETEAGVSSLPVGTYYRPSGAEVSGFEGAMTEYRRSPSPALNSLANAGHLPRDGKDIASTQVEEAIVRVFNIAEDLAQAMAGLAPSFFGFYDLAQHNNIEHDASLSRADAYFVPRKLCCI